MHMARWIQAGTLLAASAVVTVGLLGGCSDSTKESGTHVELDKEAHAEGQRRAGRFVDAALSELRRGFLRHIGVDVVLLEQFSETTPLRRDDEHLLALAQRLRQLIG